MNHLLTELIKIPSIVSEPKQIEVSFKVCEKWLAKHDIKFEQLLISGKKILVWGNEIKTAKIMFNTHIDVVPASPGSFKPHLKDEKIFGRGSGDAKGCAWGLLQATGKINNLLKEKRITFVIAADEEVGGESTKELLKNMPNLELAVFGEPTGLKLVTQSKGVMTLEITSSGKSAHGAYLWKGTNAIQEMAIKISKLYELLPVPKNETTKTTINLSRITGGQANNQVPDSCSVILDIRFNPKDQPEEITNLIKEIFNGCTVRVVRCEPALNTIADNININLFRGIMKEKHLINEPAFEQFASDARHCTKLGIPAMVFGPIAGNIHEEKEWVDLASINIFSGTIIEFIRRI